ncbi:unnamed protein product [Plutella xylostella]|uniref:(diamondback moth) hypothetical protein n=1 Tax=Plutella xylostella TaxID=51655 RepID=A0A8S4FLE5_PLUXY|nr:unnamed protein product [Plutella xylostella]
MNNDIPIKPAGCGGAHKITGTQKKPTPPNQNISSHSVTAASLSRELRKLAFGRYARPRATCLCGEGGEGEGGRRARQYPGSLRRARSLRTRRSQNPQDTFQIFPLTVCDKLFVTVPNKDCSAFSDNKTNSSNETCFTTWI